MNWNLIIGVEKWEADIALEGSASYASIAAFVEIPSVYFSSGLSPADLASTDSWFSYITKTLDLAWANDYCSTESNFLNPYATNTWLPYVISGLQCKATGTTSACQDIWGDSSTCNPCTLCNCKNVHINRCKTKAPSFSTYADQTITNASVYSAGVCVPKVPTVTKTVAASLVQGVEIVQELVTMGTEDTASGCV